MYVVFISDFGYLFIILFLISFILDLMFVYLYKSFIKRIYRSY